MLNKSLNVSIKQNKVLLSIICIELVIVMLNDYYLFYFK